MRNNDNDKDFDWEVPPYDSGSDLTYCLWLNRTAYKDTTFVALSGISDCHEFVELHNIQQVDELIGRLQEVRKIFT